MSLPPSEIAYQEAHIDEDRGPLLIAICSVFTGIALVTFVLRCVARRVARQPFGLDDYLALATAITLVGVNISACLMARYGIGKHIIAVVSNPENLPSMGKSQISMSTFYSVCIAFGKCSVLAMYSRIFGLDHPAFKFSVFRLLTYVLTIYTVLWSIGVILFTFLKCRPLSGYWGVPTQCRPEWYDSVIIGILNSASDIAVLILPQPFIWKLRLSTAKRLGISAVFLVGLCAAVVSIVRIVLVGQGDAASAYDVTYTNTDGVIVVVTEPACVLICACMPVIPGLIRLARRSQTRVTNQTYGSDRYTINSTTARDGTAHPKRGKFSGIYQSRQGASESTEALELKNQVENSTESTAKAWATV